jgi:hypothetical protein
MVPPFGLRRINVSASELQTKREGEISASEGLVNQCKASVEDGRGGVQSPGAGY